MVSDDEAKDKSIRHERAEVIMTLTKSRDKAKLESRSDLNLEDILTFLTRPGSSENICVRALINMCTISILIKKYMFHSLKHKIVEEPEAKTWTTGVDTFFIKKKVLISGCLLPLITTKHSFNMEVNYARF